MHFIAGEEAGIGQKCLKNHGKIDSGRGDVRRAKTRSLEIFQVAPNGNGGIIVNRSEIYGGCQPAEAGAVETKTTSVEIANRGA